MQILSTANNLESRIKSEGFLMSKKISKASRKAQIRLKEHSRKKIYTWKKKKENKVIPEAPKKAATAASMNYFEPKRNIF